MADGQRHLWIGDWQRHSLHDQDTAPIATEPAPVAAEPAVDAQPLRSAAAARTKERRTRAWMLAGVLGSAAFAWSFGYIIGEVHAGNDPGLQRASAETTIQPPVDDDQALPPVITQQS